jgi:Ribonuclease H2 non-catalytic subunit (Ylr154p-like)
MDRRRRDVRVSLGEAALPEGQSVHLLPFQIKYSGEARVGRYFLVQGNGGNGDVATGADAAADRSELGLGGGLRVNGSPAVGVFANQDSRGVLAVGAAEPEADPSSNDEELRSSFRGRELRGAALPLPEHYCGVVLASNDAENGSADVDDGGDGDAAMGAGEAVWECRHTFDRFVYWNRETTPTKVCVLYLFALPSPYL